MCTESGTKGVIFIFVPVFLLLVWRLFNHALHSQLLLKFRHLSKNQSSLLFGFLSLRLNTNLTPVPESDCVPPIHVIQELKNASLCAAFCCSQWWGNSRSVSNHVSKKLGHSLGCSVSLSETLTASPLSDCRSITESTWRPRLAVCNSL